MHSGIECRDSLVSYFADCVQEKFPCVVNQWVASVEKAAVLHQSAAEKRFEVAYSVFNVGLASSHKVEPRTTPIDGGLDASVGGKFRGV